MSFFWGGDTYPKYKGLESTFFIYVERRWRFEFTDKLGLESVGSVSYTHLDVYKRQVLDD